jgi:hypothetical protein
MQLNRSGANMTTEAAIHIPLSERINFRMIVFFGVFALLIGYPVYWLVHEQLTGGISDAGGGYKEVDLKAMSSFVFDQSNGKLTDIPQKWRNLDGKKVVVYGEMWQPYSANDRIAGFSLCYSIAKCCFSGPPQVQHFVQSKAVNAKNVDYYSGLVKVKGTLHVNVKKEADRVASVYQLDVERVDPVQ